MFPYSWFSKEFISYKIVHISEKSINKNTRGNFSQDCRIQSYTLHLWRFVDIIKNGYWFFSFSKFTFHLKSKHCTMFQYNIRGLPLFLITPSQIKMYKTVNISLVYLYLISLLWSLQKMVKYLSKFSNKSDDRNLNIYWLTLSLRCSHAVYEVFLSCINLTIRLSHRDSDYHLINVFNVINFQYLKYVSTDLCRYVLV